MSEEEVFFDEVEEPTPPEPSKKVLQHTLYTAAHDAVKAGDDFIYCLEEDQFYQYFNGKWEQVYEVELIVQLSKRVPRMMAMPMPSRKQVIDNLKLLKFVHLKEFNLAESLNLQNGMVNPYDGVISRHDKKFYSTLQLPYEYNQEADCSLWLKTLSEIFEGNTDKLETLQEFMGYCLTKDVRQEKALLLLGDSRSGKSTIINTLRHVVGVKNCSAVPLKFLVNPQYTAQMVSKLINVDTDVSARAIEFEDEFKKITTGEEINCNQKFIPAFTFNPYCKIVMAANDFPRITDHSSAFYKRLILIPCDRVFTEQEQNKDLRNELLKELPGILNWSIIGLRRLTERKRFERKQFMIDALEELREDSNPVEVFFREHVVARVDDDVELEKGFLYDKYVTWCKVNQQFVLSRVKFSVCVFRHFARYTPKMTSNHDTRKRVWKNLQYIDYKISQQDIGWANENNVRGG